jgi:hypothetical protein
MTFREYMTEQKRKAISVRAAYGYNITPELNQLWEVAFNAGKQASREDGLEVLMEKLFGA